MHLRNHKKSSSNDKINLLHDTEESDDETTESNYSNNPFFGITEEEISSIQIQPDLFLISTSSSSSSSISSDSADTKVFEDLFKCQNVKNQNSFMFDFPQSMNDLIISGFPEDDIKKIDSSDDLKYESESVGKPNSEQGEVNNVDEETFEFDSELENLENEIDYLDVNRANILDGSSASSFQSNPLDKLSSFFDESSRQSEQDCNNNQAIREYEGLSIDEVLATIPSDHPVFYSCYPPHNRDPSLDLPQLDLNHLKNAPIYFGEVNCPTHFWFQLVKHFDDWAQDMHIEMNEKYKNYNSTDLQISKESLTSGLVVAAYVPKFKEWYRARINWISKHFNFVHVYIFDHGTHCKLQRKRIKYLLEEYLDKPKACFRGRLYGVMPLGDERFFNIQQMDFFRDLIFDKKFVADVIRYDESENVYELKIKFFKTNQDLAELLIEKNICDFIPQEKLENRLNNDEILCLSSLTHEALETGSVPNYDKLYKTQNLEFK